MRRTDTPRARLRAAAARRRAYFTADYRAVTETNVRNLQVVCLMAIVLYPLLTGIMATLRPDWSPSPAHVAFLLGAVALLVVTRAVGRLVRRRPYAGAALCLGVQAALLGFAVVIDAVYAPNAPGVFVQPLCIALPAVIATPYALPVWESALAEALYVGAVMACKDAATVRMDAFGALVGMCVSVVLSQLVMGLRLRDFETRERYRELSLRDGLCGIYNKGALVAMANRYLATANPHASGTVLLFDIDDFKQVNDTFGHHAGDEVLRGMGDILQRGFRSTDAVGRFGGDEFMVLATGLADPAVVERKFAQVLEGLRRLGVEKLGRPVTCSAGAVWVADAAVTYESAFRQADEALYAAKRAGKGRCAVRAYRVEEPPRDRRAAAEGADTGAGAAAAPDEARLAAEPAPAVFCSRMRAGLRGVDDEKGAEAS